VDGVNSFVATRKLKRREILEKRLTSTTMPVDGLLPHPVARAGDGEDAAEDGLRGQVRVVDEPVNDDVEASAAFLVIGLRQ